MTRYMNMILVVALIQGLMRVLMSYLCAHSRSGRVQPLAFYTRKAVSVVVAQVRFWWTRRSWRTYCGAGDAEEDPGKRSRHLRMKLSILSLLKSEGILFL